jgi:hypothetical protein
MSDEKVVKMEVAGPGEEFESSPRFEFEDKADDLMGESTAVLNLSQYDGKGAFERLYASAKESLSAEYQRQEAIIASNIAVTKKVTEVLKAQHDRNMANLAEITKTFKEGT